MEWIQKMNAAVNYLEEHIFEEPDLDRLGKLAGCSAHHFQRIFTYIGGITLTEYIRKRRMALAAVDLKDENVKVIDVAMKYGYDSQPLSAGHFKRFTESRRRRQERMIFR